MTAKKKTSKKPAKKATKKVTLKKKEAKKSSKKAKAPDEPMSDKEPSSPLGDSDVSGRTNPSRVALYLPPDERAIWEQAVALSGKYDSMSGMARDLVKKYHAAMMKKVGEECPT